MKGFGNLAGNVGRLGLGIGTFGLSELAILGEKSQRDKERKELQQLTNILSQQSIPAFARAGGSMEETPQQIEQTQLRQLSALGTPAAAEIVAQRSPLTQKPTTAFSPVGKIQADINAGRISPAVGSALIKKAIGGDSGLLDRKQKLDERKFELDLKEFEKKSAAGGLEPKDSFEMSQKLRKEFTGLSGEFIKQRDAFGRVQASAEDPSAAGDLALVFNFMKVLDPGSTVREGEFATAANSAGVNDRVKAQYNKIVTGERLAPKQRNDFADRANKLFTRANSQHNKRVENFTGVAERAGLNVEDVLLDLGLAEQATTPPTAPQSPQATGEGTIATNPQTGAKLILRGGQWQPL